VAKLFSLSADREIRFADSGIRNQKNLNTRRREITSFTEAMSELNMHISIIVTRLKKERFEVESGTIDVIPVWRFLLSMDATGEAHL